MLSAFQIVFCNRLGFLSLSENRGFCTFRAYAFEFSSCITFLFFHRFAFVWLSFEFQNAREWPFAAQLNMIYIFGLLLNTLCIFMCL